VTFTSVFAMRRAPNHLPPGFGPCRSAGPPAHVTARGRPGRFASPFRRARAPASGPERAARPAVAAPASQPGKAGQGPPLPRAQQTAMPALRAPARQRPATAAPAKMWPGAHGPGRGRCRRRTRAVAPRAPAPCALRTMSGGPVRARAARQVRAPAGAHARVTSWPATCASCDADGAGSVHGAQARVTAATCALTTMREGPVRARATSRPTRCNASNLRELRRAVTPASCASHDADSAGNLRAPWHERHRRRRRWAWQSARPAPAERAGCTNM